MVMNIEKRYLGAALALVLILAFFAGMKYGDIRNKNDGEELIIESTVQTQADLPVEEEIIQVYVTGAVANPGVYRLDAEARVYEAVDMAQALPEANLSTINMAQKLEDGQAVLIPRQGEEETPSMSESFITSSSLSGSGKTGQVNINKANIQELDALPGIGPTLAQRIIDYRTAHGPFTSIESLNEVSGIGEKKYADLQDLITVR